MKELSVVARDRVGLLADVSETLGKEEINIESISQEISKQTAIIRLSTNDNKAAVKALSAAGFKTVDSGSMMLRIKDKPGELAKMSRRLASAGVNILNVYMLDEKNGEKIVALVTDDNRKAGKMLEGYL